MSSNVTNKYYSSIYIDLHKLAPGDRLPSIVKTPNSVGIVMFCAAIRNFHRFHYDESYTRSQGVKDILVPGFMMGNWCVEYVTRTLPGSIPTRLKFRNASHAFVDDKFEIVATVKEVAAVDDERFDVSCDIKITDSGGRVVTLGEVRAECPGPGHDRTCPHQDK